MFKSFRRSMGKDFWTRFRHAALCEPLDAQKLISIANEYDGPFQKDFERELCDLLEESVVVAASDGVVDVRESQRLKTLLRCFGLSKPVAMAAVNRGARRALTLAAGRMIAGHRELADNDLELLHTCARSLGMDTATTNAHILTLVQDVLQKRFDECLEDGMISDQEWADLDALATALRVDLNTSAANEEIQFARDRWQIVHGELSTFDVDDLKLQRGERVAFRGMVDWYETRKVRRSVNYAGLTGRVRLARGIYFRAGSLRYAAPSVDQLTRIASGELLLTTKRVLFLSDGGSNKTIRWSAILAVNIDSLNTFELEKDRGKSPVIDVKSATLGHPLLAPFVAQRLISDYD